MQVSKPRGISADIQSPRTKLLYFIYSAPNSRIRAEPGVKSSILSALGYKSDGHFHYDWNYLLSAGMIEEKQGYYYVTEEGKKEFALHSTAARSNRNDSHRYSDDCFYFFAGIRNCTKRECHIFWGSANCYWFLVLVSEPKKQAKIALEAKDLLKELNKH